MMHTSSIRLALALFATATLSACGESDLPEHHEQVLACANIESAAGRCDGGGEPIPGAANSSPPGGMFADRPAGEVSPGEEPVEGIDLSDYELIFSEDFDTDQLDATRWSSAFEWGPDLVINDEQQYYIDSLADTEFGATPFSMNGESLTISATRTPEALRAKANEQPWLSGVISSAGQFDLQYGYVEARVDLPQGVGVWPSFWMLASELDGRRPRVFIAEHDGADPDAVFHDYQYEDGAGAVRSAGQYRIEVPGLSQGFHTLGISWTPEELVYYVDGVARYRVVGDELPAESMYLVLNLAIGGAFVDMPDESTPESPRLEVDYVRVWQRTGS